MCIKEGFIVKGNITDNTKPVGDDAEFIGITKMSVDIHLLDGRADGSMGRHEAVSDFIRVKRIIEFLCLFKCFQLFDDTVGVLGIIFCNPGLNAGSVKKEHRGFRLIDLLADRFGKVYETIKQCL